MSILKTPQFTVPNDPEFYALRAQQARALADKAKDLGVRAIHLKMAEAYAARLDQAPVERSKLGIVQG